MNIEGIQYAFGPYLWSTELPKQIIDSLLDEGLKSTKDHRSNLAGIIEHEKGYSQTYIEKFANDIAPYVNTYLNNGQYYFKHSNNKFQSLERVSLQSLWINVMKKGECNPSHIHDGDLSFVIFLKVPEELAVENQNYKGRSSGPGCIEFSYGEWNPHAITKNSFLPKTGQMFIFPASLQHSVNSFQSDVERISVSGNFNFEYRQ